MMTLDDFMQLDRHEVAKLVNARKSSVCAFPINGTRRWFKLKHPDAYASGSPNDFLDITWREHIRIYKLLFEHGIGAILAPITGPDILARDAAYQALIEPGLRWLYEAPEMLDFYKEYGVRVGFYGDIELCFGQGPFAHLIESFQELRRQTAVHSGPLLLFGICGHDATEAVARIGHTFYQIHNRLPDKKEIIEAYYGVSVESVDFFIGFDRLTVFDMPLLGTGQEDLYFMVAPSLFMEEETFRLILFDHLYGRRVTEDYAQPADNEAFMKQFYQENAKHVIGVGRRSPDGSFWYPLPQVTLPNTLMRNGKSKTKGKGK